MRADFLNFSANSTHRSPRSVALVAAASVFCMVLAVNLVASYISYINVRHATRDYIMSMAQTAARLTNVELHQTLTQPEQKDSDVYRTVQQPYHHILQANPDLFYIYSLVPKDDRMFFVMDTQQTSEDLSGQDIGERKSTANVMEEYTEATDFLKRAIQEKIALVEDEPYSDRWGTFISAYAPVYNAHNEFVGIVGADMLATPFFARLQRVLIGFAIGVGISCLLALLTYRVVYRYGQQESGHNRAALRRLAYMESFQQEMKHVVESIAEMGQLIAERVEKISHAASENVAQAAEAERSIHGSSDCIRSISLVTGTLLETLANIEHSLRHNETSVRTSQETLRAFGSASGELTQAADGIHSIVALINEISEHIELLALNATIEAARAGESGKGFAVVAGEVKLLATQTKEATDKITSYARHMQTSVSSATGMVESLAAGIALMCESNAKTVTECGSQRDLVSQIVEDTKTVADSAQTVERDVHDIGTMASEMDQFLVDILQTMRELSEQNTALKNKVSHFLDVLKQTGLGAESISLAA